MKLPKLPPLPKRGREPGARCAVCGCRVHGNGGYGEATPDGRSHASDHHYVATRFFLNASVFQTCPWGLQNQMATCCYECHEVLLHNPVFTEEGLNQFARLVALRGLSEDSKPPTSEKLAGRIRLLHQVIEAGLDALDRSSK